MQRVARWLWRWWRGAPLAPPRRPSGPPPHPHYPGPPLARGPVYDDRARIAGRDYETKGPSTEFLAGIPPLGPESPYESPWEPRETFGKKG